MLGLSTFVMLAQGDGSNGTSQSETATGEGVEDKPDINEIIKTSNAFTNGVGMVLKKISNGLWISAYETTQKQYGEVIGANPSSFRGDKRPVDSVSWQSALAFCKQLTDHEKAEGMLPEGYRYALLSQDQWEKQARTVPLANAVNSSSRERSGTADVGSLPPNGSGLYDLRGNVAEWCADPSDGAYRVLRGGSWQDWIDINLRTEFRVMVLPTDAENTYGFRCSLVRAR
jgi:formylglycine-generating enzyme required for sulfatase activity